jgi:hypothetical protein
MNQFFGLAIESMVAILLLLTILYCARLNSRITLLKSDERTMRTTITELMMAVETAERAIGGLKATMREAQDTLTARLRDAEEFNQAMADNLKAGEDVLGRLRKIAHAGRLMAGTDEPEIAAEENTVVTGAANISDTRSIAAAAQALAERSRARVNGLAA